MSESPLFHRLCVCDTLSHTCEGNMLIYAIKITYALAITFFKFFYLKITTLGTNKKNILQVKYLYVIIFSQLIANLLLILLRV